MLASNTPTPARTKAPPYSLDRARLGLFDLLVALHLPLQFALQPAFRRFTLCLRSSFLFPPSTAAMAASIHNELAHRQQAFNAAVATMDPRPHFAVSFVPPVDGAPFLAVSVHFITKDWKLVSHVAEFAPPDLLCSVTAAAGTTNEAAIRTVQDKLHALVPEDELPVAAHTLAQVDLAAIIHGVAAAGVTVFRENGFDAWIRDLAGATAANRQIYVRCWRDYYCDDPTTAARVDFPLLDAPGKWMTTFELYEHVLGQRGILLEFLADLQDAAIAASTRPTAEVAQSRDAIAVINSPATLAPLPMIQVIYLFTILKDHAARVDLPVPVLQGVERMLATLRGHWTQIMTRTTLHAFWLDPTISAAPRILQWFLDTYAADLEGSACPCDAFPVLWRTLRDEILDDMIRTARHDRTVALGRRDDVDPTDASIRSKLARARAQELTNQVRHALSEELDAYEALADAHRARVEPRTDELEALVWWRAHEDQFPNLARAARRVFCVPATTAGTTIQALAPAADWNGPHWGKMRAAAARDLVIGRSLAEALAALGVGVDDVAKATRVVRHVPLPVPPRDEVESEVVDLEQVRERWEGAVVVGHDQVEGGPAMAGE
ncbi:hypothetical protein GGF32_009545 [Allomyces javanicus]|nr:hypothetical protein GGF32_009545 [Allomyces javanicus]